MVRCILCWGSSLVVLRVLMFPCQPEGHGGGFVCYLQGFGEYGAICMFLRVVHHVLGTVGDMLVR